MKFKTDIGFSLLEVLCVIILSLITISIAIFSVNKFISMYYINTIAHQLMNDFYMARSKAITLRKDVVISINEYNSTLNSNGSYKIFIDDGSGGGIPNNWIQDGNERLLLSRVMPKEVKLYKSTFLYDKTGFQSNGTPLKQRWGSIYLKGKHKFYRMTLILTGRIKLYYSNNGINWQ